MKTVSKPWAALLGLFYALTWRPEAGAQTIYVANNAVSGSGYIIGLSSTGVASNFVVNPGIGISFDSNGNIFGADAYGDIKKITPGGTISTFVASLGDPGAIAFDASNNLYFSTNNDSAIKRITPGGSVSTFVSGITQPGRLVFDSGGNLYVAQTTTSSVLKVTPGGAVTTFATGIGSPQGMVFDSGGNMFVSSWTTNSIIKVNPGGTTSTFATGVPNPSGLVIDAAGNLFAASASYNAIYKITTGGVVSTFADYNSAGIYNASNIAMSPSAIPEPSTYAALFGAAALGLAFWRRRVACPAQR